MLLQWRVLVDGEEVGKTSVFKAEDANAENIREERYALVRSRLSAGDIGSMVGRIQYDLVKAV